MSEPDAATALPTCPRHPARVSYLRCQRCDRPTCPDCQRPAPVGFHCVDCVAAARAATPATRTSVGGVLASGRPVATYTIMTLCAVAYVLQLAVPRFTLAWQFAPVLGPSEPWRMLTAAFLHDQGLPLHILVNMLALWQVGQWLEPLLGRARFVALYLLSAIGGSVGYLLLAAPPQTILESYRNTWVTPTVGASGAVFGLFGALLIFLRHLGRSVGGLVGLLVINAVLPLFYPIIAWQAHLGGFLTGMAIAALLLAFRDPRRRRWQWPILGAVLGVLFLLASWKYGVVDDAFIRSRLRV